MCVCVCSRACVCVCGCVCVCVFMSKAKGVIISNVSKIITFSLFFILFMETAPYPSPRCAAYSHSSVTKQWPRNCEAPGSKPC